MPKDPLHQTLWPLDERQREKKYDLPPLLPSPPMHHYHVSSCQLKTGVLFILIFYTLGVIQKGKFKSRHANI